MAQRRCPKICAVLLTCLTMVRTLGGRLQKETALAGNWRRWICSGAAVAVLAAVMSAAPAEAHDSTYPRGQYYQYPYVDSRQCIQTLASQNHGWTYGVISRYVGTFSLGHIGGTCNANLNQPAGRIAQRGWAYKDGVNCVQGGWQFNNAFNHYVDFQTSEDLWPFCNWGSGVHVTISHDVESAVWNPWDSYAIHRQARWPDGTLPTTNHCHCP